MTSIIFWQRTSKLQPIKQNGIIFLKNIHIGHTTLKCTCTSFICRHEMINQKKVRFIAFLHTIKIKKQIESY